MKLSFSKSVLLRQPFQIVSLPLEASLYIRGYGKPANRLRKFISAPVSRRLYQTGLKTIKSGKGAFTYNRGGDEKTVAFRSRNTQFHSIYLPEYTYYEPETLALVDILLSGEQVFYDIGSNWGHFSLYAASNPGFIGSIHAFEPMPSTFGDLESTVKQAGLGKQVHCYPLALSDTGGEAYLHLPDGFHSGNAMLSGKTKGVKVKQCKLDELKLPPPHLMKVDAEGHEAAIFAGGKKILEESKPFIIFENFKNLSDPEQMLAPFRELGKRGYLFFLPLFIITRDGSTLHANKQDSVPSTAPAATLGLFEFAIEERCFLDEQLNVFACHNSRVGILGQCFEH
jgi:FkbM family methyltransferase